MFRLAADPTNLALMYGAGVKTAMRTLVQSNRTALSATDKTTAFLRDFFLVELVNIIVLYFMEELLMI